MFKKGDNVIINNNDFVDTKGVIAGYTKHYKTKETWYKVKIENYPCIINKDGLWIFKFEELKMDK